MRSCSSIICRFFHNVNGHSVPLNYFNVFRKASDSLRRRKLHPRKRKRLVGCLSQHHQIPWQQVYLGFVFCMHLKRFLFVLLSPCALLWKDLISVGSPFHPSWCRWCWWWWWLWWWWSFWRPRQVVGLLDFIKPIRHNPPTTTRAAFKWPWWFFKRVQDHKWSLSKGKSGLKKAFKTTLETALPQPLSSIITTRPPFFYHHITAPRKVLWQYERSRCFKK